MLGCACVASLCFQSLGPLQASPAASESPLPSDYVEPSPAYSPSPTQLWMEWLRALHVCSLRLSILPSPFVAEATHLFSGMPHTYINISPLWRQRPLASPSQKGVCQSGDGRASNLS